MEGCTGVFKRVVRNNDKYAEKKIKKIITERQLEYKREKNKKRFLRKRGSKTRSKSKRQKEKNESAESFFKKNNILQSGIQRFST